MQRSNNMHRQVHHSHVPVQYDLFQPEFWLNIFFQLILHFQGSCIQWLLNTTKIQNSACYFLATMNIKQCLWVPVITSWRVLMLRMEERPPIWRVAANKWNKQSRTADKGSSSSLGVWWGANNSSPWKNVVKKYSWARCFLWRQNNPEVKYSPTWISGGECF